MSKIEQPHNNSYYIEHRKVQMSATGMPKHILSRQEMIDQIDRRNKNSIETQLKELSYIPDLQTKIGIILAYLSENKFVYKVVYEIHKATNLDITEDETDNILMLLKYQKQVNRRYYDNLGAVFKIREE